VFDRASRQVAGDGSPRAERAASGSTTADHEDVEEANAAASPVRRRALERVEVVRELEASRSTAWARLLRQVAALVDDMAATGGPAAPLARDGGAGPDAWGSDVGRAEEAVAAEVALALTMPLSSASAVVDQAVALCSVLTVTMAALEAGRVDQLRARVVVDETAALTDEQARAVDAQLDPCLGPLTTSQLRARVRHLVATTDRAAVRRRTRRATCDRGVRLFAAPDGMAQLVATGPGTDLAVVFDRLTTAARGREGAHGRVDPHAATVAGLDPLALADGSAGLPDRRGVDARRFDALVDLATTADLPAPGGTGGAAGTTRATGGAGSAHGPQVVVALTSLVGLDDEPAQLAGQGPVPVEQVRELLAAGHPFRRALTDPVTGQLIGLDGHLMRVGPPADDDVAGRRAPCSTAVPERPLHADEAPPPIDSAPPGPDEHAPTAGRDDPPVAGLSPPRRALRRPSRQHCPVLAAGGGSYAPARGCERFVRARALRCQAPGCRVPAARCDLDHRRAHAAGGATCPCNLDVLCRRHHLAKHHFGWSAVPTSEDPRDAGLRWTSPLGRTVNVPAEPFLPRPGTRSPTTTEAAEHRGGRSGPHQQQEDVRYLAADQAAGDPRRTRTELDRQLAETRAAEAAAAEVAHRQEREVDDPPPF